MKPKIMKAIGPYVLCASLTLSSAAVYGCASDTQSAQILAIRTLIDAEAAFNAAVTAERSAKGSGLLTGSNADRADALIVQAYSALKIARIAEKAGVNPDVGNITNLVLQIVTLTPKGAL